MLLMIDMMVARKTMHPKDIVNAMMELWEVRQATALYCSSTILIMD